MKRVNSLILNVLANIVVLAICPFLVLVWIVRVRFLEYADAHRSKQRRHADQRAQRTIFGA
jgi:hypothetical protein